MNNAVRKTSEADVLIVGGGLVGLTLAVALSGAGMAVVVIDRVDPAAMRDAAFDGRVSSLAQGSVAIMDGIGVWPDIAPDAEAINEIRVSEIGRAHV